MTTADPVTERSSCCNAQVSYSGDGELYCKACYGSVTWKDDPGAPLGVDTIGTAIRINTPNREAPS